MYETICTKNMYDEAFSRIVENNCNYEYCNKMQNSNYCTLAQPSDAKFINDKKDSPVKTRHQDYSHITRAVQYRQYRHRTSTTLPPHHMIHSAIT
jgi:hypothetical protein